MFIAAYQLAKSLAQEPRSRFVLGSPCRWIPVVDFTVHFAFPTLLRSGDLAQGSLWDRARASVARRLVKTSPRWQWLALTPEWSMA
jgi:hypothetical protein